LATLELSTTAAAAELVRATGVALVLVPMATVALLTRASAQTDEESFGEAVQRTSPR
jgi:hypothetical protein